MECRKRGEWKMQLIYKLEQEKSIIKELPELSEYSYCNVLFER
jgi:hypothetical protein